MAIDLKAIDERLAKAKEDAEFWEKARAVLLDPRMAQVAQNGHTSPTAHTPARPSTQLRPYGEMIQKVLEVLSESSSMTTSEIVDRLTKDGYAFKAKEPGIAVNGALISLQEKGLARVSGKRVNAKLWRKRKQDSQEAGLELPPAS